MTNVTYIDVEDMLYARLTFLSKRLLAWWTSQSTKDVLLKSLADARLFEEWEASAFQLDEVLGYDLWYNSSNHTLRFSLANLTHQGAKMRQANFMTTA